MGKDFRIGLILGMVLVVVALVWVATRPGLNPQVHVPRASQAAARNGGFPLTDKGVNEDLSAPPPSTARPLSNSLVPPQEEGKADATQLERAERIAENARETTESATVNPQSAIRNPQSNLPDQTIYEQPEKIKTTRFHIVRRGETLSAIARQYYGAPEAWQKILNANQKVIKDANKLTPGTKLTIPE